MLKELSYSLLTLMGNLVHYNHKFEFGIKYLLIITCPINILLPCSIIVKLNINWLQVSSLACKEI